MNTPAAANSGPCVGQPAFFGYAEGVEIGVNNGSITQTISVMGVPTGQPNAVHVAVGNIDHIAGQPMSTFTTPVGWTLMGAFDSDTTTVGTTPTGNSANWSQRTYIWRRNTGLSANYTFDLTYWGDATYRPQARVVVAVFQQVNGVATNVGEYAMQGSGVIPPVPPPAPASTAAVNVPSITTNLANTLAVGVASASNVSSINNFSPPTTPALYTTIITANGGAGYPPIWFFSRLIATPGTLPFTTGTVNPEAMNVGSRFTIECG